MNEDNNGNDVMQTEEELNRLMQIRRDKLKELQENGKDPFEITKYDRTEFSKDIKDNYDSYEGKDVSIAGRLMAKRIMGKASFCTIQDSKGRIQSYVSINDIGYWHYFDKKSSVTVGVWETQGKRLKNPNIHKSTKLIITLLPNLFLIG